MKVLFDTSVLVPAFVDQLSNHTAAFVCFTTYTSGEHEGFCSTHALAETYSVLTSLPLPKRISSAEAHLIIQENILKRLSVVELRTQDYLNALKLVSQNGLTGGIVYDALHLEAAKKARCIRGYTYNVGHFQSLSPDEQLISSP